MGTNPIFLAQRGFEVTALDISHKAVEYARRKAFENQVTMNLLVANFMNLPFTSNQFDFAFDFGCFHHVQSDRRSEFIHGIRRVLNPQGTYFMVCFSDKNGPEWNHFTREQIADLFDPYFTIAWMRHVASLEGDNVTRYFYEVFMKVIHHPHDILETIKVT
jgi:ubiquinone/menaquinone biosynthesis C-methylase UbiE